MKVTFDIAGDETIYRISDFDLKYEPVLQMCFYENDKGTYIKKYPNNAKYLDLMKNRYQKYAKAMFDQLGYFSEVPWEKGLKSFCSTIEGSGIDWWLTGSVATCIRGIELKPHDIDIMVDSSQLDRFTELFKDYLIEPIIDSSGWVVKNFGVMFMDVRIDIAGDPFDILDKPYPVDCGPYAKNHLEIIKWEGFEIKIPPLELQLYVNKKRNRNDRVVAIEDFISGEIRV